MQNCRSWVAGATLSLLTLLAGCAPSPQPVSAPSAALPAPGLPAETALAPFYQALAQLQAGTRHTPVMVLQIGDSHTANDAFSGHMRSLLQTQFGNAGRGILQGGVPFRYYNPAQVTVTAKGWKSINSLSPASVGPFGLTAFRQHAAGPATMTLTAATQGAMDVADLEVLMQPGGGALRVRFDTGATMLIPTNAPVMHAQDIPLPSRGATSVTISTINHKPVDVLSWTFVRAGAGVVYSNLGTVGARVDLVGRWDPAIVQADLARLQPSLIVFAFGTNEGFRDAEDMASYPALYRSELDMLRQDAPQAAFILIGPPDGVRRFKPTDLNAGSCGVIDGQEWDRPQNLDPVRAAIKTIAQQEGLYYWDWSHAMGGTCSMVGWAAATPPLAWPDHVHPTAAGYDLTAERLYGAIIAGFDRYNLAARAR